MSSPRAPQAKIDTSRWTRENLAWVAGFIDGEGCFYLTKDGYCLHVNAFQKDPELLHRLQDILRPSGGKIYKHPDGFSWRCNRKHEGYAILVALYQWFSTKRQKQIRHIISKLYSR